MKKPLLTMLTGLFMLCSVNLLFAQAVSNGGFETWVQTGTFEHPVVAPAPVFTSSNGESFYQYNILTATKVNGQSGKALRLENKQTPGGDTIRAYASWGNVDQGQFNGGVPLPGNQPLTGLSLYLRYSLKASTPGFVGVIPMKNGSPAGVGNGIFPGAYIYQISGTQSAFTLTNYTFAPALLQNPDSCIIIISSSNMVGDEKGTIGDFVEVDQLSWIGNSNTLYGGNLDVWQNVPTKEYPDQWNVNFEGNNVQFAKSTDAKFGNYSLELFNIQNGSEVQTARAILGRYTNCGFGGPCTTKPGMKLNATPKSFGFYYKYTTPGIDTASCYVSMFKAGVPVSGSNLMIFPSSGWTYVKFNLSTPSQTPDSIFISFESGRWGTAVAGSKLKLDGLKLHYCDDASVITGPASVCSGTNGAKFVISEEFASGFAWSTTTGTISGGTSNDTVTINSIAAGGTVSVIKTYPDGCPNKTFNYNVAIAAAATANAGADQTLCANNGCATLSGSVTAATGGVWSTSGTGTFLPSSTSLSAVYCPSPADTAAGSVALTLTPTGTGGCSVASDNLILTYTDAPKVNAGNDQTVCSNVLAVNLSGTKFASGIIWTTLGTGGTFGNSTSLTTTYKPSVNDIQSGSVKLVIASTGHPTCNVATDTMKITFDPTPTTNAGPNQAICSGTSATLAGTLSFATAGIWTGGAGTFSPNNTTFNATYTPNAAERTAGTVSLTFTPTAFSGSCTPVSDQMTITINSTTTANAGSDQSVCSGLSVTLAGTFTGATSGSWSGGAGTFSPSATTANATYAPSAAEITAGTVTLTFSATGCGTASDQMIITIKPIPSVNSAATGTICSGVAQNYNITSTVGTATFSWNRAAVANVSNSAVTNQTADPITETLNNTSTNPVVVTYVITPTAASCPGTPFNYSVTVNPAPTANAGPDQTICSNANATLAGSVTVATGGTWSGGAGTFSPSVTTANATYAPSTAERTAGTVTLTFTATAAGCTPASDQVIITINTCTGIANTKSFIKGLKVYPTRTNGLVSLEAEQGIVIKEVTVINSLQQEVTLNSLELNDNKAYFDISGLNSGVYFIRISDGNSVGVERIVKE